MPNDIFSEQLVNSTLKLEHSPKTPESFIFYPLFSLDLETFP